MASRTASARWSASSDSLNLTSAASEHSDRAIRCSTQSSRATAEIMAGKPLCPSASPSGVENALFALICPGVPSLSMVATVPLRTKKMHSSSRDAFFSAFFTAAFSAFLSTADCGATLAVSLGGDGGGEGGGCPKASCGESSPSAGATRNFFVVCSRIEVRAGGA